MKFVPRDLGDAADASRGQLPWMLAVRGLLVAALIGVGAFLALPILGETLAARLSPKREAHLFGALTLPGARPADPSRPGEARALAAFDRVRRDEAVLPMPYRLVIMPIETPNAFALPGGTVAVTTGLLEQVQGEIGLAFVLGHELGHHGHRHAVRRLGRVLALQLLLATLFGGEPHPAVGVVQHLTETAYSREQERAADDFGLRAVARTYGSLDGALALFEILAKQDADDGAASMRALGATHPLTSERLTRLREEARRLVAAMAGGAVPRLYPRPAQLGPAREIR